MHISKQRTTKNNLVKVMPPIPNKIFPIYTLSSGLCYMVHELLKIAFTINLFEIDKHGIAGSYFASAFVLGTLLAGFGGIILKSVSCYAIGLYAPLLEILTLCHICFYNTIPVHICIITFIILVCITSIEQSNSFSLINNQIPNDKKPFFISVWQIITQCFIVFADIITKYLLPRLGLKLLIGCCILIYILRVILWKLLYRINPNIQIVYKHKHGILTGFQEIIQNSSLLYLTIFRIMIHIAIITYFSSLPIIVANMAKIATNHSPTYGNLCSNRYKYVNSSFLISNIIGLWLSKKNPLCIINFPTISSTMLVLSVIISLYTLNPYWLQATAVLEGIGLFLFKSSNIIIGQALVSKEKLPHAILAGDAIVRTCAYLTACSIPRLIVLCPIQGIFPPLVILIVVCFCIALSSLKPISHLYLTQLKK